MSDYQVKICRTLPDLFGVLDALRQWDLSSPLAVKFGVVKQSRSIQQNALYWEWITIIANTFGNTKEDQHKIYKNRLAVPIFVRDDPHYADMHAAIKDLRRLGLNIHYEALKQKVLEMTSTTDFSVKQMSEYMNDIYHDALSNKIVLPVPEDMKWLKLQSMPA